MCFHESRIYSFPQQALSIHINSMTTITTFWDICYDIVLYIEWQSGFSCVKPSYIFYHFLCNSHDCKVIIPFTDAFCLSLFMMILNLGRYSVERIVLIPLSGHKEKFVFYFFLTCIKNKHKRAKVRNKVKGTVNSVKISCRANSWLSVKIFGRFADLASRWRLDLNPRASRFDVARNTWKR